MSPRDEIRRLALARPVSRKPASLAIRGIAARGNPDVVIIGGGLTGCAAAYAFAAAGVKVVLLEADRIGRGATGHRRGGSPTEPGVPFGQVEKSVGQRGARAGIPDVAPRGARLRGAAPAARHQMRPRTA